MKSAAEIGRAILERLAAQAAANRAAGDVLRAEVCAVLDRHPGERLTAKMVIKELPTRSAVSVRRVQEVLQEIRAQSSVSRSTARSAVEHTETT